MTPVIDFLTTGFDVMTDSGVTVHNYARGVYFLFCTPPPLGAKQKYEVLVGLGKIIMNYGGAKISYFGQIYIHETHRRKYLFSFYYLFKLVQLFSLNGIPNSRLNNQS